MLQGPLVTFAWLVKNNLRFRVMCDGRAAPYLNDDAADHPGFSPNVENLTAYAA
jgi:hypothetical protein